MVAQDEVQEKVVSRRTAGLVRALRWILWAVLFAAVFATLQGLPALRAANAGRLPASLAAVPAVLIALFIVGYAVYRFTLVRAGRYPAGKAMVQIALMSLVLALVVRGTGERDASGGVDRPVDLSRALASNEPELRALAAEVVRGRPRPEGIRHAERLIVLLADPAAEVRRQAHASLVALLAQDLGEGSGAEARWRAALEAGR